MTIGSPVGTVTVTLDRANKAGAPVDQARTALLATSTVDTTVDVGATGDMWNGSVAGMPFQLIDGTGPHLKHLRTRQRLHQSSTRPMMMC